MLNHLVLQGKPLYTRTDKESDHMFGNGTLPECADITVDFHTYRVVVRYADSGELVHRVDTVAGSVAQAAMLVGMELLARLLVKEHTVEETEIFVHNLTNHVNVEVTLIG